MYKIDFKDHGNIETSPEITTCQGNCKKKALKPPTPMSLLAGGISPSEIKMC